MNYYEFGSSASDTPGRRGEVYKSNSGEYWCWDHYCTGDCGTSVGGQELSWAHAFGALSWHMKQCVHES